jgi:hydrogenase-4 membrane subunit HyfE
LLFVPAALLSKLAKHLALIACLLIVGEASGGSTISAFGIFSVVLAAVIFHRSGEMIQRRQAARRTLAKLRS